MITKSKCLVLFFFAVLFTVSNGKHHRQEDDKGKESDLVFYWRRSTTDKCEPFTVFHIGCNKCVCGADQTPYCTRMACPSEPADAGEEQSNSGHRTNYRNAKRTRPHNQIGRDQV